MKIILQCIKCGSLLSQIDITVDLENMEIEVPQCKTCLKQQLKDFYSAVVDDARDRYGIDSDEAENVDDVVYDMMQVFLDALLS